MLHVLPGHTSAEAHPHETVAEARECEADFAQYENEVAAEEVRAENAWLVAAETDMRLAEETQAELAYEAFLGLR